MKERPILFSGAMVRALLAGAKTQTRRVVTPQPDSRPGMACTRLIFKNRKGMPLLDEALEATEPVLYRSLCPYGQPGDRLWVREAHYLTDNGHEKYPVYVVDEDAVREHLQSIDRLPVDFPADTKASHRRLRPSIHMPRWASRITLEITSVRVERLQDISAADALAEGIVRQPDGGYGLADTTHYHYTDPRQSYFILWEAINGAGSVDANPWVWAVEFRRLP